MKKTYIIPSMDVVEVDMLSVVAMSVPIVNDADSRDEESEMLIRNESDLFNW